MAPRRGAVGGPAPLAPPRPGALRGVPESPRLVERHAPQLLDVVGIGPDVALLITVADTPERLGTEAFFATLCGVSPVERSSGRRQFRRLNRGGDRQANAALHRIVFTRLRVDSRTQDYLHGHFRDPVVRHDLRRVSGARLPRGSISRRNCWPAQRYGAGGRCGERSTSRVISLGAKTRNGGPQKPVPRLV
ncbi:transposase [Streptomyces mirabilis]|uniref:transposase n=1 Tax=Streptomyces mirabilis TaxID=68239 RepID=UPI0036ACEB6F